MAINIIKIACVCVIYVSIALTSCEVAYLAKEWS